MRRARSDLVPKQNPFPYDGMTRSGSKGISQPANRRTPLTSGCKLLERLKKGKAVRSTRHGGRISAAASGTVFHVDPDLYPMLV
jgi:hypothetical protein